MSPPTAVLVYARTLTPLLRLPLLLTDIIAIPLCIFGGNIPGIVFISLSLPVAALDTLLWWKHWHLTSHRHSSEDNKLNISYFRILSDTILGLGLLITWIISLVESLSWWYHDEVGIIACFALFLAWLSHTTSLFAQLYFWTWTTKKQHVCQHCGHHPDSVLGVDAPLGRDSDDATAYDEDAEQDAEDALLLKVDAEA